MAFACRPHVIVCDEPTTGLDVTTQARVLETVRDLCQSHHVAAVYVSHDLAVVAELADTVAVMYAGRIVERGPRDAIFAKPRHPYTRKLLRAVPDMEGKRAVVGIAGHAPAARQPAPRLLLRAALRPGHRPLPRGVPAGHRVRGRPPRALLPRRGGARPSCPRPGRRRRRRRPATWCSSVVNLNGQLRLGPRPARHRRSRSGATSASPWWASRAAARRRWPAASPGCTPTTRATSSSAADGWPRAPAGAARRPASRSSTCSRTRTRR